MFRFKEQSPYLHLPGIKRKIYRSLAYQDLLVCSSLAGVLRAAVDDSTHTANTTLGNLLTFAPATVGAGLIGLESLVIIAKDGMQEESVKRGKPYSELSTREKAAYIAHVSVKTVLTVPLAASMGWAFFKTITAMGYSLAGNPQNLVNE